MGSISSDEYIVYFSADHGIEAVWVESVHANVTMKHAFHLYSGSGSNAYKFQDPGTSRHVPWAERTATATAAATATATAAATSATSATSLHLTCSRHTLYTVLTHSYRTANTLDRPACRVRQWHRFGYRGWLRLVC